MQEQKIICELDYLDGFAGMGAFHLGLEDAGFKFRNVYFSEIDKHAIACYKYNFPNSIYVGSITDVSRATTPNIDIFTFGWPCQDNSIAGKRKGQSAGTRSGLLHEAVRIIREFKPRLFIAENVPGLFSVNEGIDYIEAIKLLSLVDDDGPQYDVEMCVCNTRWLLPQNRERLFFVGHLRTGGGQKIFPITEDDIGSHERIGQTPVQKDNLVISANTKKGFEEVEPGDSINFSLPNSKTRRGRVGKGKGKAQTLDTQCNQGVFVGKIRRLTEIECERLQGLPQNWTKIGIYDERPTRKDLLFRENNAHLWAYESKMLGQDVCIREISSTQRYKMIGNGVTRDVVEMIGKKLLGSLFKDD